MTLLQRIRPVLERTPAVLDALLRGLPAEWVITPEAADRWSPYDVVGHLIHGERTDWIPRVEHILAHGAATPFPPFDRFAQFEESQGRPVERLLDEFRDLRAGNLARLDGLRLTEADLARPGLHPALGAVTLGQHLATWVAHDLGHLAQIARAMAKRQAGLVGPWAEYLPILER
ncbi:MAG TPA: DinB family protein [Gemmatimonadales bacterium]|nr:DinB family protein [Gemmatimonadales bacterium]